MNLKYRGFITKTQLRRYYNDIKNIEKQWGNKKENWEFRTTYNRISFRLFAFWDKSENSIVVATHGLIKKTNKTPKKEIVKAEKLRIEYLKTKKS